MKATQAKALTEQAEQDHWDRKRAEEQKHAREAKKANDLYMKNEYDKFEANVYADIRRASKDRGRSIVVSDPNRTAWDKLRKKLISDGYSIEQHYRAGEYQNMGDSAAPCNVWSEAYHYYTVSW